MPRISSFKPRADRYGRAPERRARAQRAVDAKFVKKKTWKSAAGKGAKKQQIIRRAPLVETKSKTREDVVEEFKNLGGIINDRTEFQGTKYQLYHMNPITYYMWQQGIDEHEVIGRSCLLKYMKMKVSVRFPQLGFTINDVGKTVPIVPQRYELIWGWVPAPLQRTANTTVKVSESTPDNIESHINNRVKDYLDERKDKLRYIPKHSSAIRIAGRRKVRPDLRFQSTAPLTTIDSATGADYAVGSLPMYHTSIKWNVFGRKLALEKTNFRVSDTPGLFPNYSWLPFCVFVAIDYDTLPGEAGTPRMPQMPAIAYNDIVYYTDS